MRTNILSIAVVAAMALSACSSTQETADDSIVLSSPNDTLQAGPLGDGDAAYGQSLDGVDSSLLPGSQAQLVAEIGDRVYFGYDSFALNEEASNLLSRQAQWLEQYPNTTITIEGHADERGTREYNLALGERRASAMKNFLVSLGVDSRRVSTISYGKEQPSVIGSNPSSWAQNRRGVTVVNNGAQAF